jgi:cytochrome c biogenesis protein CcmG/thiol:disulfide interchange protein DsbE
MVRAMLGLAIAGALATVLAFEARPRDAGDTDSAFLHLATNDFEAPVFERYREEYGATLRYSEHAGKGTPVVVNFWASWCVPACWNEAPRLEAAWRKYQGQILMIGVNFQDEAVTGNEFLDTFGKTYPAVRDASGRIGIEWGVFGVPATFFIRGDGTLSYTHNGEINPEVLEEQIQVLLAGNGEP